ncbi:YdcF family protein [Pseudomonadota bacterium]
MTGITLSRLIELLVLPPAGPLLLAVAGLVLLKSRQRLGWWFITVSVAVLYLTATPFVSHMLVAGLESASPLSSEQMAESQAGAIVVIAGPDGYYDAPEYRGDTAGPHMLTRLRYAAHLHHLTQLPILVIGGDGLGRGTPAAHYMKQTLEYDFKATVQWADGQSRHTFDNARYTKEVLDKEGIDTIYLVTHAWHMRRAQQAFQSHGLTVIAAPTSFTTYNQLGKGVYALVPRVQSMELSNRALHEWMGLMLSDLFE